MTKRERERDRACKNRRTTVLVEQKIEKDRRRREKMNCKNLRIETKFLNFLLMMISST